MSNQRIVSQPSAQSTMSESCGNSSSSSPTVMDILSPMESSHQDRTELVRQSTDQRTSDDVSVFSFSESVSSNRWCGCFGSSSNKNNHTQSTSNPNQHSNRNTEKPSPSLSSPNISPPLSQSQGYTPSAFQPYNSMPVPRNP